MRQDCWLTVLVASAALAWGLSGAFAPRAEAADVTIKIGWPSSAGETDPYAVGARAFKQALEAESKGRVEVQLFPNRALGDEKIGRASCRERVCQYVSISVVAGPLKKKKKQDTKNK